MPDGSARQCAKCPDNLVVGSHVGRNEFGMMCHVQCVDLTPAEVRARTHAAKRPATLDAVGGIPTTRTRDAGDDVADALERVLGRTPGIVTAPRAAVPSVAATGRDLGDDVADALDALLGRTGGTQ